MKHEILQQIAKELSPAKTGLKEAREMLELLAEVGEMDTEKEVEINNLEKKIARWEDVLEKRGVKIE